MLGILCSSTWFLCTYAIDHEEAESNGHIESSVRQS